MSPRTSPPFRADHVGSLLRPPELLAARADFAAGRIPAGQLRAVEDAAITDVVKMQEAVGLQSATDGEFRRASWHMDFIYQLGGISKAPGNLAVKFHNPSGDIEFTPASILVDSRVQIDDTIFSGDFRYLQSVVTSAVPKLTIPSPNMVHYRGGPASIDPVVYPDVEEFWADLAAAYADEVARLAALGCTYLQFDDTSLAYLNDPAQRAEIAGRGEDAEHLHLRYIGQVNAALAAKPAGLAVTTHLCRGNFRSSWAASGGYAALGMLAPAPPGLFGPWPVPYVPPVVSEVPVGAWLPSAGAGAGDMPAPVAPCWPVPVWAIAVPASAAVAIVASMIFRMSFVSLKFAVRIARSRSSQRCRFHAVPGRPLQRRSGARAVPLVRPGEEHGGLR